MASSANVTGQPAAADVATILRTFGNQIDVVLDSGPAPAGLVPATLVDMTGRAPRLVRAGAIDLGAASGPARGSARDAAGHALTRPGHED